MKLTYSIQMESVGEPKKQVEDYVLGILGDRNSSIHTERERVKELHKDDGESRYNALKNMPRKVFYGRLQAKAFNFTVTEGNLRLIDPEAFKSMLQEILSVEVAIVTKKPLSVQIPAYNDNYESISKIITPARLAQFELWLEHHSRGNTHYKPTWSQATTVANQEIAMDFFTEAMKQLPLSMKRKIGRSMMQNKSLGDPSKSFGKKLFDDATADVVQRV